MAASHLPSAPSLNNFGATPSQLGVRPSAELAQRLLTHAFGWMFAGLLLTGVNFWFTDQVLPDSNAKLRNLLINIQRKKPTLELREQVINEIPPFDQLNTTAELIARFFHDEMAARLAASEGGRVSVSRVDVWENDGSLASYREE